MKNGRNEKEKKKRKRKGKKRKSEKDGIKNKRLTDDGKKKG